MSVTAYITKTWQQSSNVVTSQSTVTNTGLIEVSEVCTAGGTNTISVSYDASEVKALFVKVDQDGTTLNPTSGTSATLTFTDATIPYTWQVDDNSPSNSWADDFTAILVTNGSATDDCNVNIEIVYAV